MSALQREMRSWQRVALLRVYRPLLSAPAPNQCETVHSRPESRRLRVRISGDHCMALKDTVQLGMSLPHRSPDRIPETMVRQVAQRAEALGFHDLWVTNNTVDPTGCFDSLAVLTYAAALPPTFRLGVWVLVLPISPPIPVPHQWPPLDFWGGGGAIRGVGRGRDADSPPFQ